ncbi:MAG: hypothetical protein H6735_28220 [Alphaproteobacteria bacterium]|nr:hypothetical protein [Alphaproteobacteria bacterium]
MSEERVVRLTDRQIELCWQLTCAMVSNDDSTRRSLDQVFLAAARFVERVDEGLASDGVELDSGRGAPGQRVTWTIQRR